MAFRLNVGAISIVVVLMISATFVGQTDAHDYCPKGFKTCRNERKCKTKVWSDIYNCGNCGVKCPKGIPHAKTECKKGKCGFECKRGWGDCDRNNTTGCETNLRASPANCGRCGKVCSAPGNGTATCANGRCRFHCDVHLHRCRRKCVDLQNDSRNCGECNKVCPDRPVTNTTPPAIGFCNAGECDLRECFPGDARVTLEYGEVKQMSALALGDKVAVMKSDGSIAYEDVYAFGHRDAAATSHFLRLTLKPIDDHMSDPAVETRNLELTALHFVPISAGNLMYKRAQDVTMGDKMWVQDASSEKSDLFVVTGIAQVTKQGLYNPYTLGGTIIVNGVVASSHSNWFLDDIFQHLDLVHLLPAAYQLVLLPVRLLYNGLGKDAYIAIYQWLDAVVGISELGRKCGGNFVASVGVASSLVAILMSRAMSKRA